jgi:hypothetical protein
MITYPMLYFLELSEGLDRFEPERAAILKSATEALAYHNRQWREGPGQGEGHYIGLDQEDILENKVLPGNRLSSMGRAHWLAWKVTGSETHRRRALAIATYMRNRLHQSPDGGYYWSYWLPTDAVVAPASREGIEGEDTSHAGLTASLPLMLSREELVFNKEDRKRLANTVVHGFARLGGGILLGDIAGNPGSSPNYVWGAARWLELSDESPEVAGRILEFFQKHVSTPHPLDLAYLIRFLKEHD